MGVWVFCAEKRGWVSRETAFFEFFLREVSTTPPPAPPVYPTGDPCQPQRTRTDCTLQAAAQGAPELEQTTQGTTRAPGRWTRCTGLHSIQDRPCRVDRNGGGVLGVSETVQIWTHSNMNDFQHKNVCKTIDINTRTCYYIDNTRTCYTTTKTGGQNHDEQ